jgi:hypothetical protein
MKSFLFIFFVIFGFLNSAAQERFVKPVDEAEKDATFLIFRSKLIEAVKKRDAKYILSVVDRNIKNSFGGNDGIAEFKKYWKIERPTSRFWDEFSAVINNGGNFVEETGNKLFFAPYTFNSFPADLDAFDYSAIFGSNVNVRAKADENAPIVANFSYNVVKILKTVGDKKNPEKTAWYEVKSLGGKRGFVKAEFVRSPIAYRAGFEKKNGKWLMTFFIAGD